MLSVIANLLAAMVIVSIPVSYIMCGIFGTVGYLILNYKHSVKTKFIIFFCNLFGGWFTFVRFMNLWCND